jgi:uncharacterized protein (TIGR04255 family)
LTVPLQESTVSHKMPISHQGSRMFEDLPPPSHAQLERAPLQFVVCQLRHEPLDAEDPSPWFAVHAAITERYPVIEAHAVQDLTVNVTPDGVQTSGDALRGYRLRSTDGVWTVALLPNFFALECSGYTGWTEFSERLTELVHVIATEVNPKIEQRLGLRFVDQLDAQGVSSAADWTQRVNSDVAGILNHPQLGSLVTFSQSIVQLREADFSVTLRHGVQPEGGSRGYLIDTDCAREGGRRFEGETVMKDVERLHTSALQIFQACLKPEYLKSLEVKA